MFQFLTKRRVPAPVDRPMPAIEPIGPDVDVTPFRSQDPLDITTTLQALAADGDLVSIYPLGGETFLSGRIAEVRLQAGQFIVEANGSTAPESGRVLLVAMPLGIKLQFRASGHWMDQPGAPLHLVADLPGEVIHLQRRRFPRLEAPLGQPFRVEFVLQGETFSMGLDDVSIGGLGLRVPASEGGILMPGQQLRRVRVELGYGKPMTVDLEVRSRRAFRSFLAGEQLHFGCRFMNLTPEASEELQRLLAQLDAARVKAAPPRIN